MLIAALLAVAPALRIAPTCAAQAETRSSAASQQPFDSARHAASAEEQSEIARLIEQLVLIDKPDMGLTSTMSGTQFAPIKSSRTFDTGLLGVDHGLETSAMVRRLVELGPKALPALLKTLDDASESKVVMEHDYRGGAMWYGHDLPINPANARELAARAEHSKVLKGPDDDRLAGFRDLEMIHKHAITRGDLAFVIIGQIVGRGYEAARYQPSACMVITSPSHDHAIADAVRAIWSSDDPARMLFDSLNADSKTPNFRGAQGALLRLAYYFGDESRASIVQRIDALDVHRIPWKSPGYAEGWRKQEEANGGEAKEILAAVAVSDDSAVVAALLRVIERTDDVEVLCACVSASVVEANTDLVIKKMAELLSSAPTEPTPGPFGHECDLLSRAARLCPDRAPALFQLWLSHGTTSCKRAVIHALRQQEKPLAWAAQILTPLLEDMTDTSWQYGPSSHRRPIRVCDEAADALTKHLEDATFELKGDAANLDRQIAVLKRRIAGETIEPKKVAEKREIDFAALPKREPLAAFDLDKIVGEIYAISDAKTLYGPYGWGGDTAAIDLAAQRITSVTKIDDWPNDVTAVDPIARDQILCYHGDKGEIVVRELRTGKELRRIATPFHGGDLNREDPMHVRGWGDAYATDDGKWLVATTSDGALHSVDLTSGEHRLLSRPAESSEDSHLPLHLVPVRGTSKFLITSLDDENSLRVWDLANQSISEIKNVPSDFWKAAWGKFAHHYVNERHEIWDLETRKPIPMLLPKEAKIVELLCDPASATAWVATEDGIVYWIDLNTGEPTSTLQASSTPVGLVRLSLSSDGTRLFFSADLSVYDSVSREATNPKTRIAIFDITDRAR